MRGRTRVLRKVAEKLKRQMVELALAGDRRVAQVA